MQKFDLMKNITLVHSIIFSLSFLFLTSCSTTIYKGDPVGKKLDYSIFDNSNYESLVEIYNNHGNFINSKEFPPIINASEVFDEGVNWLLIDIRNKAAYKTGHVNGSYNVPKEEIIDFLTNKHKPSAYEKVVIIGYSGQLAAYVTGVLRYAGFDNTYVMLFGMAAWNPEFSDVLVNGYAQKYPEMIEKTAIDSSKYIAIHTPQVLYDEHATNLTDKMPKMAKMKPSVLIIQQVNKLLKQPRKKFLLKVEELMPEIQENPNKYYTLYYLNKKAYDKGHIKGANFYQSRKDLGVDYKLTELPKDKPIVVYGKTGHTGSNAVAYLDMLGYDAHNLIFGNNSFNYDPETAIIEELLNDFPMVVGEKRTSNKILKSKKKRNQQVKKLW